MAFDMRPILSDLQILHQFTVADLAREAEVPEDTIHAMLSYKPVQAALAIKVLACLSTWYQQEYTLASVRVKLIDENGI